MPVPLEYRKEYFRKYRECHREACRGYNNAYAKRKKERGITMLIEILTEYKKRRMTNE